MGSKIFAPETMCCREAAPDIPWTCVLEYDSLRVAYCYSTTFYSPKIIELFELTCSRAYGSSSAAGAGLAANKVYSSCLKCAPLDIWAFGS